MSDERRGCLSVLFGGGRAARPSEMPSPTRKPLSYARKFQFLSPAEAAFFRVLQSALGSGYLVFPKVRLVDVCYIPRGSGYASAFNRVVSKHLDFVVCDATTLAAVAAIELDDSSHSRADRIQRDAFVDEVLKAVELPFVRFVAKAGYDPVEVRAQVAAAAQLKASH